MKSASGPSAKGVKRPIQTGFGGAAAAGGGFGFEQFRETDDFTSPVYYGEEELLKLPFRALLTKKDATTRIKAMQDLETALQTLPMDTCRDGLAHWAFLYERCQKDNDRRVRFFAAKIMRILCARLPKAMGEKRFESFAADWLCACFDPETECASISMQSLEQFNIRKYPANLIGKLSRYIRQRVPDESFDDYGGSEEEIAERCHRVRSQAMNACGFLVARHEVEDDDGLDFSEFNESSHWYKFLLAGDNDGGAFVRRAAYQLLGSLAISTKLTETISGSSAILKSVYRIVAEKERSATPQMFNALVNVAQKCDPFWDNVDGLRKGFFPELFRQIERRANDSGFASLSSLIVLLSLVPDTVWNAYGKEVFAREWFDRLLNEQSVSEGAVILAGLECLLFLMKRKFPIKDMSTEDPLSTYLISQVEHVLVGCVTNWGKICTSLQQQKEDVLVTLSHLALLVLDQDKVKDLFSDSLVDFEKRLTFIHALFVSERITDAHLNGLFVSVALDCLKDAILNQENASSSKVVCEIFDSRPKLFQTAFPTLAPGLYEESMKTFASRPKPVTSILARLIVYIHPDDVESQCESVFESLISDCDNAGIASLLICLQQELHFKPKTPSKKLTEIVSTAQDNGFWEQPVNLRIVSNWLSDDEKQSQLVKLRSRAENLLDQSKTSVPEIDVMRSTYLSFQAFEQSLWPEKTKPLVYILAYLVLDPVGNNVPIDLNEEEERLVLNWLGQFTSSSPSSAISSELEKWWCLLVLSLSRDGAKVQGRPHPNLILALIELVGLDGAFKKLAHDDNVVSTPSAFLWSLLNDSSRTRPVHVDSRLVASLLDDTETDWFKSLMETYLLTSKDDVAAVSKEVFQVIPKDWFIRNQDVTLEWAAEAFNADDISSISMLLVQAEPHLDERSVEKIQAQLVDRTVSLVGKVVSLAPTTVKNTLSPSPSPSPSPAPPAVAPVAPLKVGDAVIYTKTGAAGGPVKQSATVVAKHDDGADTYYTIRWWAEDRSRETQTVREKLTLRSEVAKELLEEEERQKKLIEVQRLLQEARSSGNRQESVRLMRLQAELAPKPKDTEEEKAKAERERQRIELEWQEKRKLREESRRSGLSAADDMADDEKEDDDVMTTNSSNEIFNVVLTSVADLTWRKSSTRFCFTSDEKDVICELLSSLPLPSRRDDKMLTVLMKILLLCPDVMGMKIESLTGGQDFLSKIVIAGTNRRNALIGELALNFSNLLSESCTGRILKEFCEKQDLVFVTEALLKSIGTLRLPARMVWDLTPKLFQLLLTGGEGFEEETRLACFACLCRYPVLISDEVATATAEEEETDSPSLESKAVDIERFIPDFLVKACLQQFLMREGDDVRACAYLVWLLVLKYIQVAWKKNPKEARETIGNWLRKDDLIYRVLGEISSHLSFAAEFNPVLQSSSDSGKSTLVALETDDVDDDVHYVQAILMTMDVEIDRDQLLQGKLASRAFFRTVQVLPALLREWWVNHLPNRFDKEGISRFTSTFVTPNVLRADMSELNEAVRNRAWDPSELAVKFSLATRLVTICSFKDDCSLEMEISFPDMYPLLPANVECTKQIGVRPDKWKRWALQIIMLLGKRDGTLSDAVQLWKQNLDKEFEGVEACPICYSVLHAVDSSLPRLPCKTCKNVFHGKCLSQWFASSHQSLCPLCKQSFLADQ